MNNFVSDNKKALKAMYKRYLLKEQGYEDEVVNSMTIDELREAYESYHEEY
jgi:hypothetical protein